MKEYVACNLCKSKEHKLVYRVKEHNIVRCSNCGLLFVNPRLNQKELYKIYNKEYFKSPGFKIQTGELYGYDDYLSEKEEIMKTFERKIRVIEKLAKKGNLLDIGCGSGFFLKLAQKYGWKAKGIDASRSAVKYAREVLKVNASIGTIENLNFKPASFDVVIMFDVIEHILDPKKQIKKVYGILKLGGLLVITTPNAESLVAKILGKKWEEFQRAREHIYFFSHKTLKRLLMSLDFKIVKIESAGRYFRLSAAVERARLQSPPIYRVLKTIVRYLGIGNLMLYINPFYKITIYAKK